MEKQTTGGTIRAIPIAGKALVKHALNCIAWGLVCGLIFGLILGKSEKPYFDKHAGFQNLKLITLLAIKTKIRGAVFVETYTTN